jgi:hypothetical protein
MSGLNGKRAAAAGGLLYVASLVVVLVATRTSPEPKESAQKIVADLLEHRSEYAFAAYVAALQGPFLLLFAAGLGRRLQWERQRLPRLWALSAKARSRRRPITVDSMHLRSTLRCC